MKTLTTGDIAKLCDVNLRTVIRWIDRGALKGFKLPGRGNNRVKVEDFIAFLNENGMPIPSELAGEGNRRVLVIDDEPAITRVIRRILQAEGYDVIIANDGFQGGTKLLQEQPALVTLDLSMPGMDGFEVLEFIRKTPDVAHTRVAVISALGDAELQRAKEAGADLVLSKPFNNDQLVSIVKELIG
ncbi:response regulator receiver domain protein (CheY-like) [Marinobacterium lacunae]|uniref:Response regulator receiver domain protein (CheY-like) n=1 Tax=Marinobacterium lacunae TaxID=1232683 RepID=A0A081FWC0_9GAMM|nr:response regulator [Marinobacterium lacunae]KEA62825.1 response regulator receiver domain protein (CheY-like) [Marinobacterium lacunae]